MNYPFSKTVNILGSTYDIAFSTVDKDPHLKHSGTVFGYTDYARKRIVLLDRGNIKDKEKDIDENEEGAILVWMSKTLRHEIVHAFLNECGLQNNTKYTGNWARNEEMVDWIAILGPKLTAAWDEAGAMIIKADNIVTKSRTKKGAVKKITRKTKEKEIIGI